MKKSSLLASGEVAALFGRVAGILESALGRVLRTVNHETVTTYWLIGFFWPAPIHDPCERAQFFQLVAISGKAGGCVLWWQ